VRLVCRPGKVAAGAVSASPWARSTPAEAPPTPDNALASCAVEEVAPGDDEGFVEVIHHKPNHGKKGPVAGKGRAGGGGSGGEKGPAVASRGGDKGPPRGAPRPERAPPAVVAGKDKW
jgi:hypothetical protein